MRDHYIPSQLGVNFVLQVYEAAYNLSMINHNLLQRHRSEDDADLLMLVTNDPIWANTYAAAALSSLGAEPRLRVMATSDACSSGTGTNDTSDATLLDDGLLCPRLLPPEYEAVNGSNITQAAVDFAAELNADPGKLAAA